MNPSSQPPLTQRSLFGDEAPRVTRPPKRRAPAESKAAPLSEELALRLSQLERKLDALSTTVERILELVAAKVVEKESYTTAEVAHLLGKRPYTVREWCRLSRVNATKTGAGRGDEEEWRISHEELHRIRNDGLLPLQHGR